MTPQLLETPNGLTDARGFRAAGVACDIRDQGNDRLDLALIHSPTPCAVAGLFTQNVFAAPPVRVCREILAEGRPVHGVVANSGNANACTGPTGLKQARAMAALAARACHAEEPFPVCSTGRIGRPLPFERIRVGITLAGLELAESPAAGLAAARAILTSDTREKLATARFTWEGATVTVAGMAKGAGMIQPRMATMLAFLATDAAAPASWLLAALAEAVRTTFNAVTVDGDTSTNDTVLLLANGASGVRVTARAPTGLRAALAEAIRLVCASLAEKIVGDGEKITKVIEVLVQGARTSADAEKVARAIGNSLLVKSSWFGEDPNWGRLLDAAGYAGVAFDPDQAALSYASYPLEAGARPVPVFRRGRPSLERAAEWKRLVSQPRFSILFDLGTGQRSFRLLSTDLTEGYVNYNKSE